MLEYRRRLPTGSPQGYGHVLYLPEVAGPGPRPLMLFLHGTGECGDDLELVTRHGPLQRVLQGEELPFVILAPQCPAGYRWENAPLVELLDAIAADKPVDGGRIYLTGLSLGGWGTWQLAAAFPERFAAIAPICGLRVPFRPGTLERLPVWCFHGAQDEVVPLKESQAMVLSLRALGGEVRFTVYPDAGHDAWTKAYASSELYAWFLSHQRRIGR